MTYNALNADQRSGTSLNGKPSLTIEQAAERIAGTGWNAADGQPLTITYAYRATAPAEIPGAAGGFTRLTDAQIRATEDALGKWAAVANITFVRVGAGGYSDDATILFGNYSTGQQDAAAFTILPGNRSSMSATGDVWLNAKADYMQSPVPGTYGYATLIHEIGHALGLLHPSDYDVGGATDPTYARDASYAEDSNEYTIMSYFDPYDTGGSIRADAPDGPLLDDVAAIQRLYGANMSTRTGNDTYGDPLAWGTIWDGGGTDTIDLHNLFYDELIDLRPGHYSNIAGNVGNASIALGTIIENAVGGQGPDVLIGNAADNVLDGSGGDDVLRGGLGGDTYLGGDGNDRAELNGNVGDYTLFTTSAGLLLRAVNGSGNQWIDRLTETVQFQNGQYLSYKDVAAYVANALPDGYTGQSSYAPSYSSGSSGLVFSGTAGKDWLTVRGNVGDYTLSRVTAFSHDPTIRVGDFVLTPKNGGEVLRIGPDVDVVQFDSGQYLSLVDVPAYISGNAALKIGGDRDDILVQDGNGAHFYRGLAGNDTLMLAGNRWDYAATSFSNYSYDNGTSGLVSSQAPVPSGPVYSGTALVASNGTGVIMIDSSVETVRFQNGERMSVADITANLGQYHETVLAAPEGEAGYLVTVRGTAGQDHLFLNGNVSDYTLYRNSDGDFNLLSKTAEWVGIDQTVDGVQFGNGQYLSLKDLGYYISGTKTFTNGGRADDILFVNRTGDQYVSGGAGNDNLYLNGNVNDYTLAKADLPAANGHPAINGYELIATNGSGNLYVDASTEVVHFQSGQYLSFVDIPAYIHGTV